MTTIKTEWDHSDLYKGITDPKLDKDIKAIEKLYADFAKKYSDRKFVQNAKSLKKALDDWNVLTEKGSAVPIWYLGLQKTVMSSPELEAASRRFTDRIVLAYKKAIFFTLTLAKIPEAKQKAYLKDKSLCQYTYLLQTIFNDAKFMLSEPEEKILAEKYAVAHTAWKQMQSTYKDSQKVKFGKKTISIGEAMSIKTDLPRKERRILHKDVMELYKTISFVAEGELNAVIKNKAIDDTLRGYKTPYESTVRGYQNDMKSIEGLVDAVTKTNSISHRFFKVKAKVLNEIEQSTDTRLTIADLATGINRTDDLKKKIPFEDVVKIVRKSFEEVGPEFAEILDNYLANGQIDVYPRQGKRTGAFCSTMIGSDKTYVLLNYSGKLPDSSTFAHEMGHAIHSDYAKTQSPIYQDYTISVAEVASTFFEHVLLDSLMKDATPTEKKDLLFTQVQDRIFTIHAQIAYFQFEKKLHAKVKEQGFVGKAEIAKMFADCRRSYVGDAIEVTEEDGYAYVYISHFRSFFYVYAYAYGQLIADALYAEYKKDKTFIEKIKVFLKAGGSMSPEDIWKSIGIDTTKPDFFKKGLKALEKDLIELEKMENMR
ncbi:MAG: M3 family metallopeptidase [Patescibacteria group bacterium]